MYLVAENRVLKVDFLKIGTSESATQVFFGSGAGKEGTGEIAGLAVSTLSSYVFINVKNRALFTFMARGELLWSFGPVLDQFGYRQGCMKSVADCYFTSVPVIDQCEASIYVSSSHPKYSSFSCKDFLSKCFSYATQDCICQSSTKLSFTVNSFIYSKNRIFALADF